VSGTRRIFHWSLEGVTTETLALSIGLAVVLGIFPVYGCPTLLCAAAAVVLRLNLPAMQLVNLLTSPLQWALLIPFHRLGAWLLSGSSAPTASVSAAAHVEAWHFIATIWMLAVHAIAGWFCICAPLGILLYVGLRWANGRAVIGGQGSVRWKCAKDLLRWQAVVPSKYLRISSRKSSCESNSGGISRSKSCFVR
jgi:uncharacterized protein (DUF2062 family)